jgi:hypothetical protein
LDRNRQVLVGEFRQFIIGDDSQFCKVLGCMPIKRQTPRSETPACFASAT